MRFQFIVLVSLPANSSLVCFLGCRTLRNSRLGNSPHTLFWLQPGEIIDLDKASCVHEIASHLGPASSLLQSRNFNLVYEWLTAKVPRGNLQTRASEGQSACGLSSSPKLLTASACLSAETSYTFTADLHLPVLPPIGVVVTASVRYHEEQDPGRIGCLIFAPSQR